MSVQLSKTRVMSGLQCIKRLYLEVYHPELVEADQPEDIRVIHGQEVGYLAQILYPEGVLIENPTDSKRAIVDTRKNMGKASSGLFEAAFEYDEVLVRTDIFVEDEGYQVTEVKAATTVKDYYLQDCAIQAWVLASAGYEPRSIRLAYVNREFVYRGDGDYTGFFIWKDVTSDIRPLMKTMADQVQELKAALEGDVPNIAVGEHCNKPFPCPFIAVCTPQTTEYPVSLLPRGKRIACELMDDGIEDIRDVPEGYLENVTWERIRRVTKSGQYELDDVLVDTINILEWPRYYLDFETIQFAVPIWKDTRPYSQLPFQWSCHIENRPGDLEHAEFLDVSGDSPLRGFAESLIETLGSEGPIMVYSAFEKSRLEELAVRFADLAPNLNGLIERLFDLLPLTRQHYYHPDMRGSYSIKAVLPTVAPQLDYKVLEQVHDGGEAQVAYMEMIDSETTSRRKMQLEQALLEYCKLDTLAMVKLAWFYSKDGEL